MMLYVPIACVGIHSDLIILEKGLMISTCFFCGFFFMYLCYECYEIYCHIFKKIKSTKQGGGDNE